MVEDNPNDAELALHAFKRYKISNNIHVVRDGAEALDFEQLTEAVRTLGFYWPLLNHSPRYQM